MGIIDRIAQVAGDFMQRVNAAPQPTRYYTSSMRVHEGYGYLGAKRQPFSHTAALQQFGAWCYAAAMLNANAVANTPLRLYVRDRGTASKLYGTRPITRKRQAYLCGDTELRPSRGVLSKAIAFAGNLVEVIEPHPALQLLRTVNPWMNGFDLTQLRMLYLQVTGNAYLHVVNAPMPDGTGGTADLPAQLWPMPSQWVEIIPSETTWIEAYSYGVTTDRKKKFAPAEVIHFKLPNPRDLHYGMGWVEAAWRSLILDASKRTRDIAFFDNMARPDWLLIVKSGGADKSITRFEEKVRERFEGPHKAGGFMSISGDVEAQQLNQEVPEVGSPTRIIEEISAASGVPVAMLLTNDPNRANSEQARLGWHRATVHPLCRTDEEKLNEQYLARWDLGDDALLAYDPVAMEDANFELRRRTGLVAAGIMTPNEARAEEGLPPMEDGEDLRVPAGSSGAASGLAGDSEPSQPPEGEDTKE